jgi:hypothetical protein
MLLNFLFITLLSLRLVTQEVQVDQKVSVHLMITVQKNTQEYFKQFQSLTMITQLELGITDGVSVSLVSVRRVNKCLETGGGTL